MASGLPAISLAPGLTRIKSPRSRDRVANNQNPVRFVSLFTPDRPHHVFSPAGD
jgi:hypothetical protein